MIALGAFWSLLSIFHRLLQPSIFRIYGAHTTNTICPQIKKQTNFTIRYDFYPSFPNRPVTAETPCQQMIPWKRFPMVKTNQCFCLFSSHSPLYYSFHLQLLWIILSKSLFWMSLNHFYLYVGLYQHPFSAGLWTGFPLAWQLLDLPPLHMLSRVRSLKHLSDHVNPLLKTIYLLLIGPETLWWLIRLYLHRSLLTSDMVFLFSLLP